MVKIYYNALGEGDWVKVYRDNELFCQGHSLNLFTIVEIINSVGVKAEIVERTDSELDKLTYCLSDER